MSNCTRRVPSFVHSPARLDIWITRVPLFWVLKRKTHIYHGRQGLQLSQKSICYRRLDISEGHYSLIKTVREGEFVSKFAASFWLHCSSKRPWRQYYFVAYQALSGTNKIRGKYGKEGRKKYEKINKICAAPEQVKFVFTKKVTKSSIQLNRVYLSLLDVTASCFKCFTQPPVNNYTWRYLLKQLYTPVSMQKPMYITERWWPPGRVPETRFVGQEMLGFRLLPI